MRPSIHRHYTVLLLSFLLPAITEAASSSELARWKTEAARVTIRRDNWGIAHVHGRTDADAVFGALYAQAEDDFPRIETNYLNALGRLAEAEGKSKIYQDLRMRLFVDPQELKAEYLASPLWLKRLMDAFADGLNYYLETHPNTKPRVLRRFEPWMALSFTEGSIGGDIERVDLKQLEEFYGGGNQVAAISEFTREPEPGGSNGIAISPAIAKDHHALLLINPHTSFFFRSELQMTSDEGLNAYGASTWGQFFIYQGFNSRVGWMHTSSGVDAVDEYLETVAPSGNGFVYRYGNTTRPVESRQVEITYKTASGSTSRKFTVYRTQHGPVIGKSGDRWITIRLMQEHIKALEQSYLRTKAEDLKSYRKTMDLHANSSNNTVYADADGNIAYFHANYIPRREASVDWTKPVDGSSPRTDWHGVLSLDESPHVVNPRTGWLFNVNNWPWSAAGADSPKQKNFPAYVESGTESARGVHAMRVLDGKQDFTLDSLTSAAYDSYLPWFDKPLPALFSAWSALPPDDGRKLPLREQISSLQQWDRRWSVDSIATSLAVFWGDALRTQAASKAKAAGMPLEDFAATRMTPGELVGALAAASKRLEEDFGKWRTPWGQINRYQRLTADITQTFDDSKPSIPVGFTWSFWGSLASFTARPYPQTKRWYGTSGNSFVAVVEFGPKVKARAVTAGGESGHPESDHFSDQAERYANGNLRDVYFYPDDVKEHTKSEYHPGQR